MKEKKTPQNQNNLKSKDKIMTHQEKKNQENESSNIGLNSCRHPNRAELPATMTLRAEENQK